MTDKLTEDEWADLQTLTAYDREGCVSVRLSVFDKLIAEVREMRAEKAQSTHCKHGHPKRFGPCPMCEFETEEDGDDR